jgi:two-component system, OmpR family, sensor histidine kinase MtrB
MLTRRSVSLRSFLIASLVLGCLLAALVSAALVLLTTSLHRATVSAAGAVEGVRLAAEAEIDLLLHQRTVDPLVRRNLEGDLLGRLVAGRRLATDEEEIQAITSALDRAEAYFAAARDPERAGGNLAASQAAAFDALDGLVDLNVEQAREAHRQATAWDRMANGIGALSVVALVLLVALLPSWLQRRAFSPLFSLAATMERFGRGDREARAQERGATELREMSRRFNEMAAALAARRQEQVAFLAGVAHDLRNPLSALQMSIAMLDVGRPLPEEGRVRQVVARIDRQISRMDRMIGDFLDMARIEAGELSLELARHDGRDIVRHAVELFEDAGRRIELSLPSQPLAVMADGLRLEQVVTNLVSNAMKYSPAGSPIEVALEPAGDEIVLRVTDRGVGISEGDRPRLFEPFRRIARSAGQAPGVGLGLSVVKRIVEAHGGQVELDSRLGHGSTFRVRLPAPRA